MRYKIVCLFIIFSCVFSYSFAAKVSPEDAQKVAINWKNYIHCQQLKSNKSSLQSQNSQLPVITKSIASVYKGTNTFYTFTFQGGGFVIVAADDNINPVLAYSDSDSIPENIDNEGIKYWIGKYNKQIWSFLNINIVNTQSKQQWTNILHNTFSVKSLKSVAPFLTTKWDQGCYYNDSCPSDSKGPCKHVYTGCVATALAQIMKYNNYPATGTGGYSYYDLPYGTLTANFGKTTFNWSNMPNSLKTYNTDVATLMYECGVAVRMSYSPTGSGATDINAERALKRYFGYTSVQLINEAYYNDSTWENTIKGNLNSYLPVYYSGTDTSIDEGHAFVCDGYENSDYFHFNWGWSGQCNGFFLLSALNPDSDPQYNFSADEVAIINIIPTATSTQNLQNNYDDFTIFNYPNPFSGNTNIHFVIPADAQVNIKIYDYTGRLLSTVVDEYLKPGVYNVPFSAYGLSSGIYYYRAELNNSNLKTGKMVIVQ